MTLGTKSLPKSFGQLINLQKLSISKCPINELHLEAGLFTCLERIELRSTDVAKISISTDQLPQLEWLQLYDNRHLKEIETPTLPNTLQRLSLISCPKLDVLPSFAQLDSLKELKIIGCYGVKKIEGLEHCGATSERLRNVELQTMSGSGFQGFIQSMKKCPREYMIVCTRAVGDAATILNSFAVPNLSLIASFIHSFANQKANHKLHSFEWPANYTLHSFEWPSTGRCILLCFVLSSTSTKTKLHLVLSGNVVGHWDTELGEGKWLWTALLTQHALLNVFMSGIVQGHVEVSCEGEVEKGVVVMGEEESAREAFTHLYCPS